MSDESRKDELPSWEGEQYRRHVKRLESLPQNQNGADKSWVHRAEEEVREHYRNAKLVR